MCHPGGNAKKRGETIASQAPWQLEPSSLSAWGWKAQRQGSVHASQAGWAR